MAASRLREGAGAEAELLPTQPGKIRTDRRKGTGQYSPLLRRKTPCPQGAVNV